MFSMSKHRKRAWARLGSSLITDVAGQILESMVEITTWLVPRCLIVGEPKEKQPYDNRNTFVKPKIRGGHCCTEAIIGGLISDNQEKRIPRYTRSDQENKSYT